MKLYCNILKPGLDYLAAVILAVILSPLFLLLAIAIKIDSPGPVFFKQKRMGRGHSPFLIYKFRTMRTDTPKDLPTHLFQDPDKYITKLGKFLRKSSLDELPQLFNILKGEMSFIGPRPALWNQEDLLAAREELGVDKLKPGITGWAQVNGRDELPIPLKAKLDGWYGEHVSLWLDMRIFWKTVAGVIKGSGVSEGGPKG